MKSSFLFQAILTIAILMAAANGTHAELMVGDKAPRLKTGKWIQGQPVRGFDRHHVYVVEFWATWCGPCVASIPHLNALWQKFKDKGVIVIGQDVWDSDNAVAPFVKKMGTNMTYRVALDNKSWFDHEGFMAEHWWKRGTNYHGIPTAFIINQQGRIAWIGHPMGLKEKVLADIVSGNYDLAKATVDYKKDLNIDNQFQALQQKLFAALKRKQWDDAQLALKGIDTLLPKMTNAFTSSRLQVLLGQKNFDTAYQLAESASKRYPKDADWQNSLAWTIATSDRPDTHCLELAESMARRARQLTNGKDSASLDTLARIQFLRGKKSAAIATEEMAVNLERNKTEKSAFERTLASYREGNLPNVNN